MKPAFTAFAASMATGLGLSGGALSTHLSALPPAQVQGEVSYVSGGVGLEEATAFRQAAANYPLELLFAQKARPNDEFIAGVHVAIRDRVGHLMLDTATDGPFLLAKLPAGKYKVAADYGGATKRQAVEIHAGKHQRAVFVWAADADQ